MVKKRSRDKKLKKAFRRKAKKFKEKLLKMRSMENIEF